MLPDKTTRRRYLRATTALGALTLTSGVAAAGNEPLDDRKEMVDEMEADVEATDPDDPTEINGCTTITEPGDYVLVEDLDVDLDSNEACIEIESNNVTFDGDGYSITGSGSGRGIEPTGVSNVLVTNVSLDDLDVGISAEEFVRGQLSRIATSNCRVGIDVTVSRSNVIRFCTIEDGSIVLDDSANDIVVENQVTGSPRSGIAGFESFANYYLNNVSSGNAVAGLRLSEADRNDIVRNTLTNNDGPGLDLISAEQNRFTDNDLNDNGDGPCAVDDDSADNVFQLNDPECEPDE